MSMAIFVALAAAATQTGTGKDVELVTTGALQAFVAETKDGLAVHPVFTDPLSSALVVRRAASGEVERHESMNDIMVARKGSVQVLFGGSVDGARETGPGEWKGGHIVGGHTRTLHPGDMLWIPAGIPHQMILAPHSSFTYLAIKVPNR